MPQDLPDQVLGQELAIYTEDFEYGRILNIVGTQSIGSTACLPLLLFL